MSDTNSAEAAARAHQKADELDSMYLRHRGTSGGDLILRRIKALREAAYLLEKTPK